MTPMTPMTHRERLLTAFRGETPDVVPVTWELVGRFAHAQKGDGGWRAQVDCHRDIGSAVFNLQGVGPNVWPDRLPDGYSDTSACETHDDGSMTFTRTLTTPRGTLRSQFMNNFVADDPLLPKKVEYLIKERCDYDIYEDYLTVAADSLVFDNKESEAAREYVGDDGLVNFWGMDALYHVGHQRHDTEYILDLVEIPDRVEALFEVVDLHTDKTVECFNASSADVFVLDICWASTSLVSPDIVKRFVVPRIMRVAEMVRGDKTWGLFTTGRIRAVLDDLVDCEPAFIQHLDVMGDCDLAEVKRTFGDCVCLMGNYSPVVLSLGSLDEARAETKRCLDAAMAGGGFVITTSDEVPANAKIDNMKAVVEYVERHGRY